MPNPLPCLAPVFDLLGTNLKILPATGGAMEELQHPDADEIEDMLLNREVGEITSFAETPTPSPLISIGPHRLFHGSEKHLFRFFIDGSLRTYYLGTGLEGQRSFPIQMAQIGAAVMVRHDDGRVSCLKIQHKILLLVPTGQYGLSDTVWQQCAAAGYGRGLVRHPGLHRRGHPPQALEAALGARDRRPRRPALRPVGPPLAGDAGGRRRGAGERGVVQP